jgi:TM2 domain-containing membrane protein YozV
MGVLASIVFCFGTIFIIACAIDWIKSSKR